MIARLNEAEMQRLPGLLPEWQLRHAPDTLHRSFRFRDFAEAWAFMTRVALLAEKYDHHPDWRNVWNRVEISLNTHEAGGLTARDITLAQSIDAVLQLRPASA